MAHQMPVAEHVSIVCWVSFLLACQLLRKPTPQILPPSQSTVPINRSPPLTPPSPSIPLTSPHPLHHDPPHLPSATASPPPSSPPSNCPLPTPHNTLLSTLNLPITLSTSTFPLNASTTSLIPNFSPSNKSAGSS